MHMSDEGSVVKLEGSSDARANLICSPGFFSWPLLYEARTVTCTSLSSVNNEEAKEAAEEARVTDERLLKARTRYRCRASGEVRARVR